MTVRMTGITGLLDTEALVSASMEPYKLKVNTQKQNLQILQWQQEQYRTVMTDSKSFYDKYLDPLGSKSLSLSSKYTTTKFTSDKENVVTATAGNGAITGEYSVSVTQLAATASTTLKTTDLSSSDKLTFNMGTADPIEIETTGKTNAEIVTELNQKFSENGIKVSAKDSQFAQGIILESSELGGDISFTASLTNGVTKINEVTETATGTYLKASITNSRGTYAIEESAKIKTNSQTIDGVTFNFKGTTETGEPATLIGTADVSDFKDNIISFVNDYNTLLSSINTKIYETRDKSYTPLTDDQKDEMSDDEIEKWEKKAQTGLLRKDSYLEDLANDMKNAMATMMSGTGLTLEDIGIEPVANYSDKNGMLTIDEDKLTNALETNFDGVKDLFINGITTSDTTNGGIITKLKDAIYSGTISSTANLVQKAGKDTGVSSLTNEMSKQLTEMNKKIAEMEDALEDREDALYTKYASLESALSSLQAQQDSLASYFTSN